ncbi:hypothetical protein HYPSUDRAFT_169073 [Hypholoma sublateritium FD-334 SS-4]|uniref:Zinc-ribbon 15 domain-containing protein n=1 Tax=Hypholoma sublateritium (strain FD-334 SS-4) TaxID=945553 RepID=A0A0D2PEG0_HYPSF|nr:hypothetical protein HYPSUDRAFT_169073 [Hypholoma sublateritium FD-334 SS-4]
MFFCIPIIFGCPSKIKPEGGESARLLCPNCHNLSVMRAKSTMWFELFWVPLVPLHWKHIWMCTICNWSQKVQKGQDDTKAPAESAAPASLATTPPSYTPPRQPGYQPAYIGQTGPAGSPAKV